MRVLITGACGFIGSHLVEHFAAAGHEVIAADLPAALAAPPGDRTRFPGVCAAAGARLQPLDVTDPASCRQAVRGAELCVHVAAVFSYSAPEELLRAVNVDGTRNLFEALVATGSCRRVVNFGAGGVYGYPRGEVFTEDSPKRPVNAYLRSKWDQEVLAHGYRERGLEVTSVRPTSPYGPRAHYGSGLLLLGLAARPVAFANLAGLNLPFIHIADLCRAVEHLAAYGPADGEAYNASDDGLLDAVGLARICAEETGGRARVLPPVPLAITRKLLSLAARVAMALARRRGTRPVLEYDSVQYFGRDYRYSNDKLKATGFSFDWPEPEPGIRATLRWYLEHGWLTPATGGGG